MNPVMFGLIAAAFVALAAPAAAKPGAPGFDEGAPRERDRTDSIATCTRDLEPAPGADPDEIEALCSCAADRLSRETAAPPETDPLAGMPAAMQRALHRCIGEMQPAAAGALIAQSMRPPNLPPLPDAVPDKPTAATPAEPAAAPAGPSPGERFGAILAWLDGTGLPRWAWAPLLLLLILAFLRFLFHRGDRDDDLMGPPRAMRPGDRPRR